MLTQHAQARCKQRGIRSEVVDVLLDYGRRKRRHGAEICYLDRAGRQRAWSDMGCKAYAENRRSVTYLPRPQRRWTGCHGRQKISTNSHLANG